MSKPIVLLSIGLVFGAGLGFLLASGMNHGAEMHDGKVHDHAAHDHGNATGHGKMIEAGTPTPTLAVSVHPDGPQSRNLHIAVSNFTFAPLAVNGPHVAGQGHAHIYVNGVKFARSYGPWMQLDALPKGTHEIRVTLNANDHAHLAVNGVPIEAVTEITIE